MDPKDETYYVKVRTKGEKAFWFLAGKDGSMSRLRVKAVRFGKANAYKTAIEINEQNPHVEAIVVLADGSRSARGYHPQRSDLEKGGR